MTEESARADHAAGEQRAGYVPRPPARRGGPPPLLVTLMGAMLAVSATVLAAPVISRGLFGPTYAAVVLASWYGGTRYGLLAAVLSVLGVNFTVFQPVGSLALTDAGDYVTLAVAMGIAWFIGSLTGGLRSAQLAAVRTSAELEDANELLQQQAVELEVANQELEEQALALEKTIGSLQQTSAALQTRTEAAEAAERKLELSEARLVSVFEQAPVAIAVARGTVADELRFELANPFYLHFLPRREVIGRTLGEVVPELQPRVRDVLQRVLDTGEPFEADEFHLAYDRWLTGKLEDAWFNIVYHPLLDEDGTVAGIITVATEVTQQVRLRREAEEARGRAEEASRAKSDFLAIMSHELRTPLNAIGGYVQLMEMGLHGPVTPEQHADLSRIARNQQHLLGLINNVLDFARIEAHGVDLKLEDVPLDEALANVEVLVLPLVEAKTLSYSNQAMCGAVVRADRARLEQILVNLLSNATKFTPEGGRITIRCRQEADRVAVSVEDTGVGVPRDKLEAIFHPFVQVSSGFTRTAEGTGLGLAISRELAREMGGDIRVESRVGEGSTFTLTLRRPEPDGVKPAPGTSRKSN